MVPPCVCVSRVPASVEELTDLSEQQLDIQAAIRDRETNITKIEALKVATVNNQINVTKYENKSVD